MQIYFASPDGTGDGLTINTPSSVVAAQQLAQGSSDNVTVYLLGGEYDLSSSPVLLTSADSGKLGKQVVWRKYPGEARPVFNGGTKLENWTLHNAGLDMYVADAPTGFNAKSIFIDGVRAYRTKKSTSGSNIEPGDNAVEIFDATVPWPMTNLQHVELVLDPIYKWVQWRIAVDTGQRAGDTTTLWFHTNWQEYTNIWDDLPNPQFPTEVSRIENVFELLTEPGDFYHNSVTGQVYYIPRAGEDLSTADCWMPTGTHAVKSAWESRVERFTLRDVECKYFGANPLDYQGVDYQTVVDGSGAEPAYGYAIDLQGVDNTVSILMCDVKHVDVGGIRVGEESKDAIIAANDLEDIGRVMGVRVDGGRSFSEATQNENRVLRAQVRSNRVRDFGNIEPAGCDGINFRYNIGSKVWHNHVENGGYSGISGPGVWYETGTIYHADDDIAFNYVDSTNKQKFDGAGIYFYGNAEGRKVRENVITSIGPGGSISGHTPVAIYADENTVYTTIEENVVFSGGAEYAASQGSRWLYLHQVGDFLHNEEGTVLTVKDNYRTSDLPDITNTLPQGGVIDISGTTTIDPENLPTRVQEIVDNAGTELLLSTSSVEGNISIYGWKKDAEAVALTVDGGTVQDYEEFGERWTATITNIQDSLEIIASNGLKTSTFSLLQNIIKTPSGLPGGTLLKSNGTSGGVILRKSGSGWTT